MVSARYRDNLFRSRLKPHERPSTKVKELEHLTPVQPEPALAQWLSQRPEKSEITPRNPSERERKKHQKFVAGSENTIVKRNVEITFRLNKKIVPNSLRYYRCNRTPQTLFETLEQLKPTMPPKVVSNHQVHEEGNNETSSDEWEDSKKPARKVEEKEEDQPETASTNAEEVSDSNAKSAPVTDYPAEAEPKKKKKKKKKTVSKKKDAAKKPPAKKRAPPNSRNRRPWKWFPCQECLACVRRDDCGKCGQCNSGIGQCILRQCITPVRAEALTPKVLPSDDESLRSMESDVSDLEWEEAFPKEEFGDLTREDLWKRWSSDTTAGGSITVTTVATNTQAEPSISI